MFPKDSIYPSRYTIRDFSPSHTSSHTSSTICIRHQLSACYTALSARPADIALIFISLSGGFKTFLKSHIQFKVLWLVWPIASLTLNQSYHVRSRFEKRFITSDPGEVYCLQELICFLLIELLESWTVVQLIYCQLLKWWMVVKQNTNNVSFWHQPHNRWASSSNPCRDIIYVSLSKPWSMLTTSQI